MTDTCDRQADQPGSPQQPGSLIAGSRATSKLAARFDGFRISCRDLVELGLTEQENVAVTLFLGLASVAPHHQHEVAHALNLSRHRVHQLLLTALGRIERQRYPRMPE